MKLLRVGLQVHKWVALLIGVQVILWVCGGLVMSAIPIEIVRSEHRAAKPTVAPIDVTSVTPLADAARRAGIGDVTTARLAASPLGPIWVLESGGAVVRIDARSGQRLAAIDRMRALVLAEAAYVGDAHARSVTLLAKAPAETGKTGPLWRVVFGDWEGTTLYLSPDTGEVVSRRSNVWRFYDFFWRLHIMDWPNGENFNNPLLIAAAIAAMTLAMSGATLLVIRLRRDVTRSAGGT